MKTKRYQKGETLIEALGAMAIIVVVITAVASSVITALNNAKSNENATLATKFAQQGIEQVRQIRDTDYAGFRLYDGLYCLGKNQKTLGSKQNACARPNVDTFIRSVEINQRPGCSRDVPEVSVAVAFTDSKCAQGVYCHKQVYTTCLSTVKPYQSL